MLPLTAAVIRSSFINASRKEVTDLVLPTGLAELDFSKLDFLGWRDPKSARRAYVVAPVGEGFVGVLLRQSEMAPRSRAQCSWCQDVTLPNPVTFYSAKLAGPAGRKGDTIGTLVCTDFECSANARTAPPVAYLGFDVEAARAERMSRLREHVSTFVERVRSAG